MLAVAPGSAAAAPASSDPESGVAPQLFLTACSSPPLPVPVTEKEEVIYLTTLSTHSIYGYMALDIW